MNADRFGSLHSTDVLTGLCLMIFQDPRRDLCTLYIYNTLICPYLGDTCLTIPAFPILLSTSIHIVHIIEKGPMPA